MKRYFESLKSLDRFSFSLRSFKESERCEHCGRYEYLVSHGYVYKKRGCGQVLEKVGKRIYCSNRYKHRGCGHTMQLYLANEVKGHAYRTTHFFIFISKLILGFAICKAYHAATQTLDARNSYRWLSKLFASLSNYRLSSGSYLREGVSAESSIKARPNNRRLSLLLPTLASLLSCSGFSASCTHQAQDSVALYQLRHNADFI